MTKLIKIASLIYLLFANSFVFSQNNILVIDYNNAFSSDQYNNASIIYNRLLSTQANVVRVNAIPASINPATYNQVWIFGNMGPASNTPIVNYINNGGAVYVQSEVGCCNTEAAFVDQLINATTVAGGSITHSTIKKGNFEFEPHSSLVSPTWTERGGAVRIFSGVSANNILFIANNTCGGVGAATTGDVVGVRFASCDMISGQGALISIGDFNVFPFSTACAQSLLLGSTNNNVVIDFIANLFPSLLTCSTLPITLSNYEVECLNNNKKISWSTSAEINNDYFTIEKSVDAVNWEIVTLIQGAGNSNQQINYSYIDDSYENTNQTIYYRLKQTDFNGNFEYFNILPIRCEGATSPIIFPNPTTNTITISGKEINKIEIIDVLGRIVKQVEPVGNNIEIDISTFSNGSYMIRIYGINQSSVHKIIKK